MRTGEQLLAARCRDNWQLTCGVDEWEFSTILPGGRSVTVVWMPTAERPASGETAFNASHVVRQEGGNVAIRPTTEADAMALIAEGVSGLEKACKGWFDEAAEEAEAWEGSYAEPLAEGMAEGDFRGHVLEALRVHLNAISGGQFHITSLTADDEPTAADFAGFMAGVRAASERTVPMTEADRAAAEALMFGDQFPAGGKVYTRTPVQTDTGELFLLPGGTQAALLAADPSKRIDVSGSVLADWCTECQGYRSGDATRCRKCGGVGVVIP